MESGKIWFVTGASAGLGLALVKALLEQGHRVAATSRDVDALLEATGAALDGRLLPLAVDLGDERSVRRAVDVAYARLRRPGRGGEQRRLRRAGPLDQLSDAALREGFDIGVFGAMNVIRAAMRLARAAWRACVQCVVDPGLRWRGRGLGRVQRGKFALGGLTEALAVEAAPHGVRVTLVYLARRACRPRSRVPLSRPRRPSTRHGICSWAGTPSIRRASRSNRCSKSWRAGARCRSPSVRSTSAAWPREARGRRRGASGRKHPRPLGKRPCSPLGMARASQALENLVDAQQRQARHEAQLEDARRQPAAQPLSQSHAQ